MKKFWKKKSPNQGHKGPSPAAKQIAEDLKKTKNLPPPIPPRGKDGKNGEQVMSALNSSLSITKGHDTISLEAPQQHEEDLERITSTGEVEGIVTL